MIVAHARDVPNLGKGRKKNDPGDAEKLARYARFDPTLLHPIQHRSHEAQLDLIVIRVRAQLVNARTLLINTARGIVKSLGSRLPECSADGFAKRCQQQLPAELFSVLLPLVQQIGTMTDQIKAYDDQIQHLADQRYLDTKGLRTVPGVGALTALTFVLTLGDKARFAKNGRDVGCYVGMRPRQSQSGEHDPQLGITKAGNSYLRKLLVQSAHYILGPFGPDSAVRRWGLGLAAHGGQKRRNGRWSRWRGSWPCSYIHSGCAVGPTCLSPCAGARGGTSLKGSMKLEDRQGYQDTKSAEVVKRLCV